MVIRRCEQYVVNGMGKISVMTAMDRDAAKDAGEPEVLWEGYAVLGTMTSEGVAQFPVEFDFDATSIDDAFGKFKELAVARLKDDMKKAQQRQEKQQSKIITASTVPQTKLYMP